MVSLNKLSYICIYTHIYYMKLINLLEYYISISFCVVDEGQTVCGTPEDKEGQRLGELGMELRTLCHQTLDSLDYLFFVLIGFVIFAAGTVSAWVMGTVMVFYERYIKKKSQQPDTDEEDETSDQNNTSRAQSDLGNGKLLTSQNV